MHMVNEVMEVRWIGCRERAICDDCDFEHYAVVDGQRWQKCI